MAHDLPSRLRKARQELRLTQAEASVEWGVRLRTLSSWENSQCTPHAFTLSALNRMLDSILGEPPGEPAGGPPSPRAPGSFAETVLRHAREGRHVNPLALWHAESLRDDGNQSRDSAG